MSYTNDEAPKPATGPRKGEGKMDEATLKSTLGQLLTSAHNYVETELAPWRAKATKYYRGEPFGNEEKGRSQVVLTELRDGVLGALPSMMRVFFSADRPVEFVPRTPEAVEMAEQATEAIQRIFMVENDGFLQTYSVLKDGLVRRLGAFKWGWEETSESKQVRREGISREELEQLVQDPSVTLTSGEEREDGLYDVELTIGSDGRMWVLAVPPEELWFTPEARSFDDATCVAHATEKTHGELRALGVSDEVIEAHAGPTRLIRDSEEAQVRQPDGVLLDDPESGEPNDRTLYVEAYVYLDYDGDGIAELRQICTVGDSFHPVKNVPVLERPFAPYTPDPEPHTLVGQGWGDRLMDLQLTKSSVLRASLDSLALSIFPRTAVVEGQVNMADVLNTEIGAPIRQRAPGMAQPFEHPFVGKEAFPVLAYLDEVRESRTGQSKGTIGLDADALQSSAPGAVEAAVQASAAQLEMQVRIFAEMTLKKLFRGMLRTLHEHKPRARMMKLRGKWVEVDPAHWDADMQVEVNVALGSAMIETKLAALEKFLAKQEMIMQLLGPDNPLVSLVEYHATLDKAAKLLGHPDSSPFFKRVTEEQLQAMKEAEAQQPPPPSPEMMLAQAQIEVEKMKTQKDLAIKQEELRLRRLEILLEDDRQRDKQAADLAAKERELELKEAEIEAKYAIALQDAQLADATERHRIKTQSAVDVLRSEQEQEAATEQARISAEQAQRQAEMEAQMGAEAQAE